MRIRNWQILPLMILLAGRAPANAEPTSLTTTVLIKLLNEADVPAQEAGILADVGVGEGDHVDPGDVLARIEDAEMQVLLETARLEVEIATKNANNDVAVQTAEKTREVAQGLYDRALAAEARFHKSISMAEMERLRLDAAKAELAIRQATHELEVAKVTLQLKKAELSLATCGLERRKIVAPFPGIVTEVARNRGEWVQPGEKVLRLIRLDRLRAEGFLPADAVSGELIGSATTILVETGGRSGQRFKGQVVYVSPEVDPVNDQVRVLAEIENPDLVLRPGLRARMSVTAVPSPKR